MAKTEKELTALKQQYPRLRGKVIAEPEEIYARRTPNDPEIRVE